MKECENFGFIEKKYTDYEKKIIIGADDSIFEAYLYLPYRDFSGLPAVICCTEKGKEDFPYADIIEKGSAAMFFRNEFLNIGNISKEDEITFQFLRCADFILSSEIFDAEKIYFAGIGSKEAFENSDKAKGCFDKENLT